MDIQVGIEPVEFDDMANRAPAEPSSEIRKRVMAAREIQQARFKDLAGIHCNAQMSATNGLPMEQAIAASVEARHIAEANGYRALDRPSNFGVAF